ncbi:MAG: YebC/PmpR family DNA-binding transcriptional regulator [Planctomycetaceae bacterium]|nr:YebC/PmpR family DNA-binding transcriptional regulator [Planctomycetaceae bacterium]
MGRQWLQKKREINANKRAAMTTKLVREISVAAKMGAPDPAMNARLAVAVEAARKASVSNDVIARAIKKGSGEGADAMQLELVTFEGMSPQNVPVVVECLTDNRNRTAPDMRMLFRGGQFGTKVMFFFDYVGLIEASHTSSALDLEEVAIEAGAQDVEPAEGLEEGCAGRFITDPKDLDAVTQALRASGWSVTASDLGYRAKEPATLSEEDRAAHDAFLESIDDHDDCHRIYSA